VNAGLLESITTAEHQNATEFLWEPRGRFFVSVCSAWRQQSETGYQFYSFNGRLLAKVLKPKFFEFHWRPRPPSLLSSKEEKAVLKKMKGTGKKKKKKNWGFFVLSFFSETQREFEKEDELRRRLENRKFFEERLAIRGGYYKALEESLKEYDQLAQKHQALLAKLKRDEDVQVFEETIEQVHSETITVL
jgi:translation initiation factor 3 subunit B